MAKFRKINWARLIAQIISVLIFIFMAVMLIGHIFGDSRDDATITLWEAIAIMFFPVGVLAGLIIAWKKEVLGGIINIASMAIFFTYMCILRGRILEGWIWIIFILPGILFIISNYKTKKEN